MLQMHYYWRPGLIAGLVGVILVVPWLRSAPQMRKATATLRVIPASDDDQDYSHGMSGQMARLMSSAVLHNVMLRLDLMHDSVFVDGFEGTNDQLLSRVQSGLMEALHVERGEAGELHISASYPSAVRAAQIANAVADAYLHLVAGNDHGTLPCTAPSDGAAASAGSEVGSSGDRCAIESKQELDAAHLELKRLSQRMNAARDRVVAIQAQTNTAAASRPRGAIRKTLAHASSAHAKTAITARYVTRPRTLRRNTGGGGEALLEAARADLDAARDAYFQVLDCYTASHSLCMPVSVPKLANLVEGAAIPIEMEKPGQKGMLLMLTFVASAVLGCCRPLTYEPPR